MDYILIVEDDVPVGDMLTELLTKEGYRVGRAYSGTEALLALEVARPNLVLLDLMLPGLAGEQVLPKLRGIPVIVLSAKAEPDSKVAMLLGGAVDYITKPFDTRELLARITVALRRGGNLPEPEICFEDLRLDAAAHTAWVGEQSVRLTRTESAILKLLLQNPEQVLPRSLILERILDDTPDGTDGSLKIHVSNLRKKLRPLNSRASIEAVWGIGFRMEKASSRR